MGPLRCPCIGCTNKQEDCQYTCAEFLLYQDELDRELVKRIRNSRLEE